MALAESIKSITKSSSTQQLRQDVTRIQLEGDRHESRKGVARCDSVDCTRSDVPALRDGGFADIDRVCRHGGGLSFSKEWDARYSENTHLSVWPWSDLVSYFYRYAKPFSADSKILEIGFGAGANIPFFESLGVAYSGIEGSQAIHSRVCARFPALADKLYLGDFLCFDFPEIYGVIVDRAAMTHNSTLAIKNGLKRLGKHLAAGGKYIGIDWFSASHSDFLAGE